MADALKPWATTLEIDDADHSLHVRRRSGRTDAEALEDVLDRTFLWMQAGRI